MASIITLRYALRPMGSWWPNGTVCIPQRVSAISNYQNPRFHPTTGPAARGPNDIARRRLQPCAFVSRDRYCGSLPAALFVALYLYDTAVLLSTFESTTPPVVLLVDPRYNEFVQFVTVHVLDDPNV